MPLNITLDATMLDTFLTCPAKYDMRFKQRFVPVQKAAPLDRGTLIHIAFEHYYLALQAEKEYRDRVQLALQAFDLAVVSDSELNDDDVNKVRSAIVTSLEVNRPLDERLEIIAVEQSFIYELFSDEEVKIHMMGKIDLLVNDRPHYFNLPYDHKSYERDSPLTRRTNQFCNYANAVGSNYLIVNRVGLQTSIAPEKKHKRVPLAYDELFINQWKVNVVNWIKNYYIPCFVNESFPMNDTSCNKFNRLCEYNDVCDSSGVEAKMFKLNAHFNIAEVWDVSSVLGKRKLAE